MKKHPTFKFIKHTKIWFIISLLVIALGIFGMINNKSQTGQALSLGIDFTGGSLMEFDFEAESVDRDALREVIEGVYPESVSQVTITHEDSYIVQLKELSQEQLTQVNTSVEAELGSFELLRFTTIGPKVGATLKRKAFVSLTIALVAIVLYIAYAFRKIPKRVSPWRFGFSAILALAHDILITLGIFALLGLEIDIYFITALLTIMGFSVHDTIVVFDRIRENLQRQKREQSFGDIADISLNQTLARSINTSISTLFPLLALYIWGAPSIQTFVFALIIGILVGTYSSIFIASPVLTIWQEAKRKRS